MIMDTLRIAGSTAPNLYTYPARPISGGPFPKAQQKVGEWIYEPKYNGWRTLVHIPTRTMFNRKGDQLSIQSEFKAALDWLCPTLDAGGFKWVDCEALERRHGIGRGCLIVLDIIPEPNLAKLTYRERREALRPPILWELDCFTKPWCLESKARWCLSADGFPLVSRPPAVAPVTAWVDLQLANQRLGCPFYEGLVAKRADSPYPIQLRGSDEEFPFWVKHRWQF